MPKNPAQVPPESPPGKPDSPGKPDPDIATPPGGEPPPPPPPQNPGPVE